MEKMKPAAPLSLTFSSRLNASQSELWEWIITPASVRSEFPWWFAMTFPQSVADLSDSALPLGRPMFNSWLLLCGFIPVGRSRLTFTELRIAEGFIEQSPMTAMRLWRHERWLELPETGLEAEHVAAVIIHDRLTFQPILALPALRSLACRVVALLFEHRHAVLQQRFAG